MAQKEVKKEDFSATSMAMFVLDIILALLIIFSARRLVDSSMGKVALLFGLTMLAIVTIFRVFQKW
jgi:hypothetical protein